MSEVAGAGCPVCGAAAASGARFCEACGAPLPGAPAAAASPGGGVPAAGAPVAGAPAAPACAECGATIDEDGYCTACGAKAPSPRDHVVERPQPWVGAVSDRGVRRTRNEDAFAVAAGGAPGEFAVLVVCDGVSSAEASDVASLAAAGAARDVLVRTRPGVAGEGSTATAGARLTSAADAANRAVVRATPHDHGESPASCTFVVALLENGRITAGVVGDSRAYWLPDDGQARLLTVDDSLAAELIATGIERAEAEAGPFAHTITRWLGVDSPGHAPRLTTQDVDGAGWLLACSDGLWNYCSPAGDLAALVRRTAAAAGEEPLATASALVDWANAQGGHDNITVTLARLGAAATTPGSPDTKG